MVMTSFGKGLAIKEVNGINCTRVGKAICVVSAMADWRSVFLASALL